MSTRRAKQHKEDTFFDVLDRKNAKANDEGGRFNRFLNKVTCRPYKFRKRAYYRENDLEGKILEKKAQQSLKTEPLGLLQFVKAPFDPDPFEPFWATKEEQHDK